jgi:anti-anti-sigma regulatory factor
VDRGDSKVQQPIDGAEFPFAVLGHRRNGVDRLSLLGALNDRTVSLLESVLDEIAHAGGATILDLHRLISVDIEAVHALEEIGRRAAEEDRLFFVVNVRDPVRQVFERGGAGDLLTEDLVDVLASGDGDWARISLPPLPGERTRMTRLRIAENVP